MKKNLIILMSFIYVVGCSQSQTDMNQEVTTTYQAADNTLNQVYQTILEAYKTDPLFIENLKISQRIWIKFRDAEVKVKYPETEPGFYGSSHSMCVSLYLEQLTKQRTETLQVWLNGIEEGDICSGSVKNSAKQEDRLVKNIEVEKDKYLIESTSFYGISKGTPIEKNRAVLKKGVLKTGEGDFDVFYIKNEQGETLGHITPAFNDESTVGKIYIDTPLAKTKQGVHVGMTFGELEKILGPVEVHGSEIESRTYASKDGIMYLLDAYFGTYEIDKKQIKKHTKIKEIII